MAGPFQRGRRHIHRSIERAILHPVSPPCTVLSHVRCPSTAGRSSGRSALASTVNKKSKKEKEKKKEFQMDLLHLTNGEVAHERSMDPSISHLNGYRC